MIEISSILVFVSLVIICSVAVYYIRKRDNGNNGSENEPKAEDFDISE